jgi:hypothetical protein
VCLCVRLHLHLQFFQDIYLVFEYMEVSGAILAAAAASLSLWRDSRAPGPGPGRVQVGVRSLTVCLLRAVPAG